MKIFMKSFAPWSTYVEYSPTLRIEICPIEKCKLTAGMLYQLFSDMTIGIKKKIRLLKIILHMLKMW